MTRFRLSLLATALAVAVPAQDDATAKAQKLLDRVDELRLGKAKAGVDRDRIIIKGTYELHVSGPQESNLAGPFTHWFAGDEMRTEIDYKEWGKMQRACNKQLAWDDHPAFGATVYRGADADVLTRALGFLRYRGWRTLYATAVWQRQEVVDGNEQDVLSMQPHVGDRKDVWMIEQQTGLPSRIDMVLPGDMGKITMTYGDWREIDGVLYPFVERGVNASATGVNTTVRIEHGAEIPDATFEVPDKIQKMIASGETENLDCRINLVKEQPVASIREKVDMRNIQKHLSVALPEIMQYLVAEGIETVGQPFTRYHDLGDGKGTFDIECGIPVKTKITPKGRVKASALPGGAVATTWHIGPYQELPKSYERLQTWIKRQGHKITSGPWEIYWTDPGIEKDPKKWRTQVLAPIEREGADKDK